MRAGPLRHRIEIHQNIGLTRDSVGGNIDQWELLHRAQARFAYQGGKEFDVALKINAGIDELIVIRWRPDIQIQKLHTRRVIFGTRTFDVLYGVDPDERHQQIHIHAREIH